MTRRLASPSGRGSRRAAGPVLGSDRRSRTAALSLAILLAVAGVLTGTGCRGEGGEGSDPEADGAERTASFELYFPGEGGQLFTEERELRVTEDPRARARAVVLALLEGPRSGRLHRPFPQEVGLLDLYLDAAGTAYVDLGAEGQESPPPGGSLEEMTRVYSLVDSVVYNVPEARRVVLLWNGVQRESFAGHLDTSVPLEASAEILAPQVRRSAGAAR